MRTYGFTTFISILAITWLCVGCRTSSQRTTSSSTQHVSAGVLDTQSESSSSSDSTITVESTEDTERYRIRYEYDTSRTDSLGISPLSSVTIEGSKKNLNTKKNSANTSRSDTQSSSSSSVQVSENKTNSTNEARQTKVLSGIDTGIRNGLTIGIPIVLIILIIYYYGHKKNTPI